MKTLKFNKEPEYADLWDAFLYNFLYDKNEYIREILSLFKKIGITKKSKILDSCAGTGFIALHLRKLGYDVECMDPMEDQIRVFKRKAKILKVCQQIKKIVWKEIPKTYKNKKFDFIFCRGNSFIYADGGWNKQQKVNVKSSLNSYKRTLRIFYNQLKEGGYLYLDKFPDNENHLNKLICYLKIGKKPKEELIFFTKKIPLKRYREARAIRRKSDGSELGLPNITLDLRGYELERMLKTVGFKYKKLRLKSETHFIVWLAYK
ncbi:class I SAM-dependent methyltransferase [Candidatus Pacearchaeota archaeon]|nr:class I SAM-dependent methyltransferase [Candidatus Pacearchaeota archaeon]